MDTAVAVYRAARGFTLVMIAMALAARDDPEVLAVLALMCADPAMLAALMIMIALAMPDVTERRN